MSILFFDYWTTGIHNFVPLYERLQKLGFSAQMLHLGSLRDPSIPQRQVLNEIVCEDISLYGGSIAKALSKLRPRVVVMLNTTLTIDRTVNRLCRMMGIRTIYLMHGITAIGNDLDELVQHQSAHWTVVKRFGKVKKYARLSLGYLAVIAKHNPIEMLDPRTYGHFVQMVLWPCASQQRPWLHKDIYCDRALVYANVYRDSLLKETGYPKDRVIVVGNPNLDSAYALARDPQAPIRALARIEALGVVQGRKAVVYMEDAFPEQGIGGWTEQTRINELRTIARSVQAAGFDLIVKMHPGSNSKAAVEEFSNDDQTHIVLKADLSELILGCVATIGHISTTLMLPVVLERPLIVPTWSPGLERLGYYVTAGAATPATSPEKLIELLINLDALASLDNNRLQGFVREFITHTDGCSQDRIVAEIVACASFLPSHLYVSAP